VHPLVSPNNNNEPAAVAQSFQVDFYTRNGTTSICTVTTSSGDGTYTCGNLGATATAVASLGAYSTLAENSPYAAGRSPTVGVVG
jgi:hypothetical protein